MDLGSSLERQQESVLQQEEHELPTLPERRRKGNGVGAAVSVPFIILQFLIVCGGLVTLTVFVLAGHNVNKGTSSRCILFASYDTKNSPPFQFGKQVICQYVVWSMAAISIAGALYICLSCSRLFCSLCFGLATFNALAVVDIIIFVFMTLISVSVALIVRLGHKETCDAVYKTYPESVSMNITNCSGTAISNDNKDVEFSNSLYATEMSAWATSVILVVVSFIHCILLIGFLLKCCYGSKRKTSQLPDNDDESPFHHRTKLHDDDSDDEPLLDPNSDDWKSSSTNSDHTSFPPYNIGYPSYSEREDNY